MRKIKKKYLQRLKVLQVTPGDIIILEINESIADDRFVRIKESLQPLFPENKILILEKLKIGVIRKESSIFIDIRKEIKSPPAPKPSKGMLSPYR